MEFKKLAYDDSSRSIDMSLLTILLSTTTMALSLWATMRVRQVCSKFSLLRGTSELTGAEAAATILQREGIYDLEILEHDRALGDHYDPARKRLVLSSETFHGMSVAALVLRHTSLAMPYNTRKLTRHYNGGSPQWV